jgi:hypothetical protein
MKYFAGLFAMAIAAFFGSFFASKSSAATESPVMEVNVVNDHLPQVITSVKKDIPKTFAGEKIPLYNPDVKERLERELLVNSYWHSSTVLHMKLAHRYLPIIEKILAEKGLPDDFKYLAIAESSLRNVTSPSGAKGIWQFMTPTAKAYDLEINAEVDERYHLEKATRAACDYLKDYRDRFGSWTLAAAAYNMGGTRLSREMDAQKESSYYDLNLSDETMRYVFRIVAIKEIIENPNDYGFYLEQEELYEPFDNYREVVVDKSIASLADFAHEKGTTYRMLKIYNPWLRTDRLTVSSGNSYAIRIPI